ncbi:MAG: hypothetical protein OXG44_10305 [Gammaproteobacteria bacterium]|nr:hypothetical protein [Gammaproteobacteria bacterium]
MLHKDGERQDPADALVWRPGGSRVVLPGTGCEAHFIEYFAARDVAVRRRAARELLDEFDRLCVRQLRDTGEFRLPGARSPRCARVARRTGRNPRTGSRPAPGRACGYRPSDDGRAGASGAAENRMEPSGSPSARKTSAST